MERLELHESHQSLNALFMDQEDIERVLTYGDPSGEHRALRDAAAVMDLSFRSRVCLIGSDRVRYLNGQVTNNIKSLQPGRGCYAALTTAKGRMESDLHVHCLNDELLLDFEPGLTERVSARLEKFIVADAVEVVDMQPSYGLLSVQGPRADEVMHQLALPHELPEGVYHSITIKNAANEELIVVRLPRFGALGFDLFLPNSLLGKFWDHLIDAARSVGGGACGWEAMEMARIEAGLPRYGQDMDETNIPLEAGLETRAISYTKGCYVGQEVINRIHSVGQVAKALRGLELTTTGRDLPARGHKLYLRGKEVGYVTSALDSPTFKRHIALGYVRREVNQPGTSLSLHAETDGPEATVIELPFVPQNPEQ